MGMGRAMVRARGRAGARVTGLFKGRLDRLHDASTRGGTVGLQLDALVRVRVRVRVRVSRSPTFTNLLTHSPAPSARRARARAMG